jgi:hypothetical protein
VQKVNRMFIVDVNVLRIVSFANVFLAIVVHSAIDWRRGTVGCGQNGREVSDVDTHMTTHACMHAKQHCVVWSI